MSYNIASCYAPDALRDTIYDIRPLVVWAAFILQLLAIAISTTGGGVGSQHQYNRRKSDPVNNLDSDNNRTQYVLGSTGFLETPQ